MVRVVHGSVGEEGPVRNGEDDLVGSRGQAEPLLDAQGVAEDVDTDQSCEPRTAQEGGVKLGGPA